MVQSQLASAPDSGVLLADEALDGSGSGARPAWGKNDDGDIDDEDVGDNDDEEASGSGMGPTTTCNYTFTASYLIKSIDLSPQIGLLHVILINLMFLIFQIRRAQMIRANRTRYRPAVSQ